MGNPVPMATVSLENTFVRLIGFANTDANGVYNLYNVPPGDYFISAWHKDYGESRRVSIKNVLDHAEVVNEISILEVGDFQGAVFTTQWRRVGGRLLPVYQPVYGALITIAEDPARFGVSAKNGTFKIDELPIGKYKVTVLKPGFRPMSVLLIIKPHTITKYSFYLSQVFLFSV